MVVSFFIKTPPWGDKIKAVYFFEKQINANSIYGSGICYTFYEPCATETDSITSYRFSVGNKSVKDSVQITRHKRTEVVKIAINRIPGAHMEPINID